MFSKKSCSNISGKVSKVWVFTPLVSVVQKYTSFKRDLFYFIFKEIHLARMH